MIAASKRSEDAEPAAIVNSSLPQLNPIDYPNIKYWTHTQFKNRKKDSKGVLTPGAKADSDEKFAFIQFKDGSFGTPIDLKRIRAVMRRKFRDLVDMRVAPDSWGKRTTVLETEVMLAVYSAHPELAYCQDHWKLHAIRRQTHTHLGFDIVGTT